MTRDEAVARVKVYMGFRRDLDSVITTTMQEAQTYFEKLPVLPWFLETEYQATTTFAPSGSPLVYEDRVPLPTDFLREKENEPLQLLVPNSSPATYVPLEKRDHDFIQNYFKISQQTNNVSGVEFSTITQVGIPRVYSISKDYFRLAPKPDAVYSLRFIYMKKDQTLDSNIQNLWLTHYPRLFIGFCLENLATSALPNANAAQLGGKMQSDALVMMQQETEWREHTNTSYAMGMDL